MIHSITANQPTFRPVKLRRGLNVILADRTEGSSRRDTRNGLGKSTLIEIIHFCLGAKVLRDRGLAIPALEEWAFTMEMTLGGDRITVTRALKAPNTVTVSGLGTRWSDIPDANLMGERSFTQALWRTFLGRALFSLPPSDAPKYNPSFRTLISYFVRRGHHAFGDPFVHTRHQQTWNVQLHVALLLGLEWRHAVQWQGIKDRDKDLKSLAKLVDRGAVPYVSGSTGELEAEAVTLLQEIEDNSRALGNFKVHPQYESIQREADEVTEELHAAANANVLTARRLKLYRQAMESEEPPSGDSIGQVYEEMGVVFSENVKRSLAEAREFYGLVVKDRRRFLQGEVSRLERQMADTKDRIRGLTETRAGLLQADGWRADGNIAWNRVRPASGVVRGRCLVGPPARRRLPDAVLAVGNGGGSPHLLAQSGLDSDGHYTKSMQVTPLTPVGTDDSLRWSCTETRYPLRKVVDEVAVRAPAAWRSAVHSHRGARLGQDRVPRGDRVAHRTSPSETPTRSREVDSSQSEGEIPDSRNGGAPEEKRRPLLLRIW